MYYQDDSQKHATQLKNLKILELIRHTPEEACKTDPKARAAFEESLRQLAEDIIELNPGLAHVLIGMGGDPDDAYHGQN